MKEEESLKTKIIVNASDLFLTKGFKSVTMDDLASNMAMSKKTIYTYFKTKNDLVKKVSNYLSDIIINEVESIGQHNYNPIEELYVISDFVQKNLKKENSSPIYQLQKYYPKIHSELIKKQFEVSYSCILRNLTTGIDAGLYRRDLNIEFISRLYFNSTVTLKDHEKFPSEDFPTSKTVNEYLDYHFNGITTNKGLKILKQIQQKRK